MTAETVWLDGCDIVTRQGLVRGDGKNSNRSYTSDHNINCFTIASYIYF